MQGVRQLIRDFAILGSFAWFDSVNQSNRPKQINREIYLQKEIDTDKIEILRDRGLSALPALLRWQGWQGNQSWPSKRSKADKEEVKQTKQNKGCNTIKIL